jgi:adenine-specific DNA-methyltransferase
MLRDNARRLRREQTDAERKLWSRLRDRRLGGAKFRRQHPIGPYIADFCCPEARLVIELDGGQHGVHRDDDRRRTAFLTQQGYRVLRFWNNQVLQEPEAVLSRLAEALRPSTDPHPRPLSEGERG